ncbi:MAG: hypothetical protein VX453_03500 [Acidobacteriota bacterium]|nr:hypothetical protein [Acidobacteriota bacterium]
MPTCYAQEAALTLLRKPPELVESKTRNSEATFPDKLPAANIQGQDI